MDDLVRAGKVRYMCCYNYFALQLSEARCILRTLNVNAFITNQLRYNMPERDFEREPVPCCQAHNVGIIPWFPLAGDFLTGKYRKGDERPTDWHLSGTSPAGPPR